TFFPIVTSGTKPSRFGGSTCNTRTGAMAGTTEGAPPPCGSAAAAVVVAATEAAAELEAAFALDKTAVAAVFNAFKSSAVRTPFPLKRRKCRSRFGLAGGVARLLTSLLRRMLWKPSSGNNGAGGGFNPAAGAGLAAGSGAGDAVVSEAAVLFAGAPGPLPKAD